MPVVGPVHGKNSRVDLNGTIAKADSYTVTPEVDDVRTRNFESGGYDEGVPGFESCEIKVNLYWNSAQNPHSDPPNITPGATIPNVKIYTSVSLDKYFNFSEIRIISVPISSKVDDVVRVEFTARSNGSFTYPV